MWRKKLSFILFGYQNKDFFVLTSPFDEVRNAAKAQLHAALQSHFNYKLISTFTQKSLLKD
jgi:hypothetical protein